jgi:hypothetical protein
MHTMNRCFALITLALLTGCATAPGFQSLYVGDGNLQWFVEPVNLEPQAGNSVAVDFTYRRIRGEVNFVRLNVTWHYQNAPKGTTTPQFVLDGGAPIAATQVQVLYHERGQKTVRLSAIVSEHDFLRLVAAPHGRFLLVSDDRTETFATSAAFESVLKQVAVELQP